MFLMFYNFNGSSSRVVSCLSIDHELSDRIKPMIRLRNYQVFYISTLRSLSSLWSTYYLVVVLVLVVVLGLVLVLLLILLLVLVPNDLQVPPK